MQTDYQGKRGSCAIRYISQLASTSSGILSTAIISIVEAGVGLGLRVHHCRICHFSSTSLKLMILHIKVGKASDEEVEVGTKYKKRATRCCCISFVPFISSTNFLASSFHRIILDSFCHFHSFCNLVLSLPLIFNHEGCHGFPGIRCCLLPRRCYRQRHSC